MIISDQKYEDLIPEGTKNFLYKTSGKQRLKNL
jgi:hypothetical protein